MSVEFVRKASIVVWIPGELKELVSYGAKGRVEQALKEEVSNFLCDKAFRLDEVTAAWVAYDHHDGQVPKMEVAIYLTNDLIGNISHICDLLGIIADLLKDTTQGELGNGWVSKRMVTVHSQLGTHSTSVTVEKPVSTKHTEVVTECHQ